MNNWKSSIQIAAMLVLAWSVPAVSGQTTQAKTNSANGSPPPATRVSDRQEIVKACSAAVDELTATRGLVTTLDAENAALRDRLETEKQANALLTELNATRKNESDALRAAIMAKNETIAAKDAALAAQDKLIGDLKGKRSSPWRRLGDILIGAAVTAILK